jgi:hypothetical protein
LQGFTNIPILARTFEKNYSVYKIAESAVRLSVSADQTVPKLLGGKNTKFENSVKVRQKISTWVKNQSTIMDTLNAVLPTYLLAFRTHFPKYI